MRDLLLAGLGQPWFALAPPVAGARNRAGLDQETTSTRILMGQPILKIKDAHATMKPKLTVMNAQRANVEYTWFMILRIALLSPPNRVR